MPARKVMVTKLITLKPTDTVDDAARQMIEHDISHLPVVDDDMHVLGIVTEVHILHLLLPWYVDLFDGAAFLPDDFEPFEQGLIHSGELRVSEVMAQDFETANEDTTLPELATRMLKPGVRRILILRDGKLVGTVSRRDVVQEILKY